MPSQLSTISGSNDILSPGFRKKRALLTAKKYSHVPTVTVNTKAGTRVGETLILYYYSHTVKGALRYDAVAMNRVASFCFFLVAGLGPFTGYSAPTPALLAVFPCALVAAIGIAMPWLPYPGVLAPAIAQVETVL